MHLPALGTLFYKLYAFFFIYLLSNFLIKTQQTYNLTQLMYDFFKILYIFII